jgi:hypothetical protein
LNFVDQSEVQKGEVQMNVTTVGVDLAKHVFAVCEGDGRGHGWPSSMLESSGEFLKWLRTLAGGHGGSDGGMQFCA